MRNRVPHGIYSVYICMQLCAHMRNNAVIMIYTHKQHQHISTYHEWVCEGVWVCSCKRMGNSSMRAPGELLYAARDRAHQGELGDIYSIDSMYVYVCRYGYVHVSK